MTPTRLSPRRSIAAGATLIAVVVVLASIASAAAAGGGRPTHQTVITKIGSQTVQLTQAPPCIGTATIVYHDTFTITDFGDGVLHLADAQAGTFTFVSSANSDTYTGSYSGTFMHQSPPPSPGTPGENFVESGTFRLTGTAADGSHLSFLVLFHITVTPAGDPTSFIDAASCTQT
jgi:hypothetical protein